jgi:hypothetical protein
MNDAPRFAWHPQRGLRVLSRLKPGWVWADEVEPGELVVKPLPKPGVTVRRLG